MSQSYGFYVTEFNMAYSIFDKDDDGLITVHEMSQILNSLGQHLTEAELREVIDGIDERGELHWQTDTVKSRYIEPHLQSIHRYNVLFPRSRFHVMENSRSRYNVLSL